MKLYQKILVAFIFFTNFAPSSWLHAAEEKINEVQIFNPLTLEETAKNIVGHWYAENLRDIVQNGNGQENLDLLANRFPPQYFKDYLNQKNLNLLHKAADHYSIPHMQFLLDAGVDINQQDGYGYTPLHHICINPDFLWDPIKNQQEYQQFKTDIEKNGNRLTTAEFLIHNGANPNIPLHPIYIENSILHTLSYKNKENNSEILQLIIKHGANVNKKNIKGSTALHYTEDLETIDILIQNGANPNTLDYMNQTPLFKKILNHLNHDYNSDKNIITTTIEKLILAGTDTTIKAKLNSDPEPQTILQYLESQEIKAHKIHFLTKIQQVRIAIYQALNILQEKEIMSMSVEDLQSRQLQIDEKVIREQRYAILAKEKK